MQVWEHGRANTQLNPEPGLTHTARTRNVGVIRIFFMQNFTIFSVILKFISRFSAVGEIVCFVERFSLISQHVRIRSYGIYVTCADDVSAGGSQQQQQHA